MNVTFQARHVSISPGLKEFAREKVEHLATYMSTIERADIRFDRDGVHDSNHHLVHLIVATPGPVFRARATSNDPRTAVEEAAERVYRQIRDFKRKRSGKPAHGRKQLPDNRRSGPIPGQGDDQVRPGQ